MRTWKSSVELLKSPYFAQVLSMDFKTIVIETFPLEAACVGNIHDNYSGRYRGLEYRGMYEIACHLLTRYRHSGKTFILQNWEGDWYTLDPRKIGDIHANPTPSSIRNFIDWINCRQAAVEQARKDCGEENVRVLHALELNLAGRAMKNLPSVGRDVVPDTAPDLLSYSAYETLWDASLYAETIDYLAELAPKGLLHGRKRFYIGEFGYPCNGMEEDVVYRNVEEAVRVAYQKGLLHAIYWQLYCNETVDGSVSEEAGGNKGYWLITPSGKKTQGWQCLRDLLESEQPARLPSVG